MDWLLEQQSSIELEITDNSFHYQRDTQNIAAEAAKDGIYVIRFLRHS